MVVWWQRLLCKQTHRAGLQGLLVLRARRTLQLSLRVMFAVDSTVSIHRKEVYIKNVSHVFGEVHVAFHSRKVAGKHGSLGAFIRHSAT